MFILKRIYDILVRTMGAGLHLASFFHSKANKWISGRKLWRKNLEENIPNDRPLVWFHCASLGEFEQGRNLIEYINQSHPSYFILLTFFSPSGFEVRKNYQGANLVTYLPLDTPQNARDFIEICQPVLTVFIKYDLWLNYLYALQSRPRILIAAQMRPDSSFIKSQFAPLYKEALLGFNAVFTQNQQTAQLLSEFTGHQSIIESNDTRYDRVIANQKNFKRIPEIEKFRAGRLCIIAGSTWPVGEKMLFKAFENLSLAGNACCMIIAPHEIHHAEIEKWINKHPERSIRFSEIEQLNSSHNILWIDNIGMLSRLYNYADLAYVGGAWTKGLHNILEAAVFGCPIVIGPKYGKYPEASTLIEEGVCFSVENQTEFTRTLNELLSDEKERMEIDKKAKTFVRKEAGATQQIIAWCEQNGLLGHEYTNDS